jgi:membrane dipeptidase
VKRIPIVDAHLDMAWNVLRGRDYDLTAADLRAKEQRSTEQAMVTFPELRRGGIAVAFGTLYTGARNYDENGDGIYERPPDDDARRQLEVYLGWESDGKARIVRSRSDLDTHLAEWENDGVLGVVLLIEGGDSIRSPDELPMWVDAGVRVIGPAWSRTRYCGGTRRPGPLTALGYELLAGMKELRVILDVSHMAEQSFWDSMEAGAHRVIATHANARTIVPAHRPDRHLSDDMLRALGDAGGVVGVVPANSFLDDEWDREGGDQLPMGAVGRHMHHIAGIIGWDSVAIGSDLDGGFGAEETPDGLDTIADLAKIGDVVPEEVREGVLSGNWLRMLRESLP